MNELINDLPVGQRLQTGGCLCKRICQVDVSRVTHTLCYLLHGILIGIHIALIAVFFKHTEHHIIIPLDSTGISTALKALLQLFYTVCSPLFVTPF